MVDIELLEIRKKWGFIDNVHVTLRIFNRVVKTTIFRDLDGIEKFEDRLKDAEWVEDCVRYAVRTLLSGEAFLQHSPKNPLVEGKKFSLLELLEA